ncbi:10466_t:CDS:10 [Ambispora gerdemannii]|uniref:Nuclear pore complex protein Nup85 n=1 Tax=Ambispora gerdemannii TaxID=144530 RepID=A0A9N8WGN8_9GLOM|nr:10466_t:CDS:10 [Ambispora gerdemannii]
MYRIEQDSVGVTFNPTPKNDVAYYLARKYPKEQVEEHKQADGKIYIDSLNSIASWQKLLYNDVHNLFIQAQQIANNELATNVDAFQNSSLRSTLCQVAREYSSILENHAKDLKKQLEDDAYNSDFHQMMEFFSIWELCRILLFSPRRKSTDLASDLVYWVNKFIPPNELTLEEEHHLETVLKPQNEPLFRDHLIKLVLRGDIRAKELLSRCLIGDETNLSDRAIESVLQAISSKPQGKDIEEVDYIIKWVDWRAECSKLQDQLKLPDKELQFILNAILDILRGDDAIILNNCTTWADSLGCLLLHHYPTTTDHTELRVVLDICFRAKPVEDERDSEKAVIKFLCQEIDQGLIQCQNVDLWLAAHLSDILSKFAKIDTIPQSKTSSGAPFIDWLLAFRESCLLDYGELLAGHSTLWSIAFDYFKYCPKYGIDYIQQLIVKIPMDTETKIHKVLNICKKYDLREESKTICKIVAHKFLREKRYTSSLSYFAKANDKLQIKLITHQFLNDVIDTGELKYEEIIESLPLQEIADTSLNFLSQYCEFHHLLQERNFETAKSLLMNLIKSQESPKSFWPVLLVNTLPLLRQGSEKSDAKSVFTREEIFEILCILEEITSFHKNNQEFEKSMRCIMKWHTRDNGYDEIDDKLKIVRLRLAHDSAKAFTAKRNPIYNDFF